MRPYQRITPIALAIAAFLLRISFSGSLSASMVLYDFNEGPGEWYEMREGIKGGSLDTAPTGIIEPMTGGDLRANSKAAGDDIQLIPVGSKIKPGTTIVAPGPNGILDSPPNGDDGTQQALALDVEFPHTCCAAISREFNWFDYDALSFDVYLPDGTPDDTQAIVFLKDFDERWYQALIRAPLHHGTLPSTSEAQSQLALNGWTTISVDISDESTDWTFKGHSKPWSGCVRQEITLLGVKFFSKETYSGEIYIDNIRVGRRASRDTLSSGPVQLLNFRTNSDVVSQYEKFEITFDLSRTYSNPFDPEVIDVTACFISSSGHIIIVPAFFYQDYEREVTQRQERLTAVGRGEWKVRFAPQQVGDYRYNIRINDGTATATELHKLTVLPTDGAKPEKSRGFVRISERDPNYFEFDNGEFFYPIGHNICAPFDTRGASTLGLSVFFHEGASAYDRYFEGMSKNGETLGRLWLVPWSFEIEWSRSYDPHYRDLGRYNLENAWRLDYLLHRAEKLGVYLIITLDPHGKFTEETDSDWQSSPYFARNGGFLSNPESYFTSPLARRYYEKRLRYILARWGYSTAIFAWEVLNEIDLVEYYGGRFGRGGDAAPTITKWQKEAARFIRKHDQGEHIITSNVFFWSNGSPTWSQKEVEFTSAHLFSDQHDDLDLAAMIKFVNRSMARYRKIFLVTESGSQVMGATPEQTEKDIHTAIWASYMMPIAASAMPWWWVFIDDRDLYWHFRALSNFAKGEDRRGKRLKSGVAAVIDLAKDESKRRSRRRFRVECLKNDHTAYFWVYDRNALSDFRYWRSSEEPPEKPAIQIRDLEDGDYEVEFWDTYKGEVTRTIQAQAISGKLVIAVPAITKDFACKLKKRGRRQKDARRDDK